MSPPVDSALCADQSAHMASLYTKTFTTLVLAEARRSHGVPAKVLWSETLLKSAVTHTDRIEKPRDWYKRQLVSDAAMSVRRRPPLARTEKTSMAMERLSETGASHFTRNRLYKDFDLSKLSGIGMSVIGGQSKSDITMAEVGRI
jgi:hypothetical protein